MGANVSVLTPADNATVAVKDSVLEKVYSLAISLATHRLYGKIIVRALETRVTSPNHDLQKRQHEIPAFKPVQAMNISKAVLLNHGT